MPLEITWQDIVFRLLCTVGAGVIIGINREEHGRTAGLRTTILLCLAAALSMILANLMLDMTGKTQGSFIQLDLMRLPLGVLSGMGFIGAGAILRRDNLILGVTTAATLWFVTLVGLCFGAGHLILGSSATAIGFLVLTCLKWLEKRMKLERHATLTIEVGDEKATEDEITAPFLQAGFQINFSKITYDQSGRICQISSEVKWRGPLGDSRPPPFVKDLMARHRFSRMDWQILGEA